jgi:hypothetical protein
MALKLTSKHKYMYCTRICVCFFEKIEKWFNHSFAIIANAFCVPTPAKLAPDTAAGSARVQACGSPQRYHTPGVVGGAPSHSTGPNISCTLRGTASQCGTSDPAAEPSNG